MSKKTTHISDEGQTTPTSRRRLPPADRPRVAHRAPRGVKQGFEDGRARGHDCGVEDILYATAAATGFAVGVSEAMLETLAAPWGWIFGNVVGEPAE
jgi:hypothetical protein